jgi:transposase
MWFRRAQRQCFCAIYDKKSYSEVKEYDTTMPKIRQMGEYFRSEGITKVAMENTSAYWVAIWDVLLEMGFELMLVNPFLIKQMLGRKSDVKDAKWIACLLHKGMLRGNMISSPTIQELRVYARKYTKLQEQKCSSLQKMDRIMVMCGYRSAGKYKSTATTKENKYLRSVLVQVSWAASRMKNGWFKEKFNRLAVRESRKNA